jgi:hypothetical protein
MVLSVLNQILVILILIVCTIMLDRIFLKSSKNLPSVLEEFNTWKGTKENFIDFKKYQYNQVFWQSAQAMTFSIFMAGIVIILKDFTIEIIGFIPWLTWLFCSLYPLAKFSNKILPRACETSIKNMKILLEGNN